MFSFLSRYSTKKSPHRCPNPSGKIADRGALRRSLRYNDTPVFINLVSFFDFFMYLTMTITT